MSTIWDVLRKYADEVRYNVKDTASLEAKKFRITYRGIIVNGDKLIKSGSAQELDIVLQKLLVKNHDTRPDHILKNDYQNILSKEPS